MKTSAMIPSLSRSMLVLAGASLLGLPSLGLAAKTAEPVYENHIDFSTGYIPQTGDRPGFQKAYQLNQKGSVGIEDLYYTTGLKNDAVLTLKGHALAGNEDYLFDLAIVKEDAGYVKLGYKSYRVWFDGTGGYHPGNGFSLRLYDEDLHLDRSNLWFEAGYVPVDKLNFIFRYDLYMREGKKDSTSWGDTALAINSANTRGLLPSFYKIDEKRHQLTGTLSKQSEGTAWELGMRYDKGDYTNSRNERRRAKESTDRTITHKEGRDYDLFMVRGSYINQIQEKLLVTTAVMRNKIDSTISGTRIYGPDYDPVYDATWANRQQRDEGFINLSGDTEMKQTVGTISAMYQPDENWTIVPAFRNFHRRLWNTGSLSRKF